MKLLLQFLLFSIVFGVKQKCGQDFVPKHEIHKSTEGDSRKLEQTERQVLYIYQFIRTEADFTSIDNDVSSNKITSIQASLIKRQVLISNSFFQKLLKVNPRSSPLKMPSNSDNTCVEQKIGSDNLLHSTNSGYPNKDFGIVVTTENSPQEIFLAWASPCLQTEKRPVLGRLNYNTALIFNQPDFFGFETALETTLHEILHILVFNPSLIQQFTNTPSDSIDSSEEIWKVVTPNVKAWVKEHYNCDRAEGFDLENNGGDGTKHSHWERTYLKNEIMTGSDISGDIYLSGATIALLRDSPYYDVEDIQDNIIWGKGKGCDFLYLECYEKTNFREFCQPRNNKQKPFEFDCSFNYESIARCQSNDMTDQCGIQINQIECLNEQNKFQSPAIDASFGNFYGANSRCFKSDLKLNNHFYGAVDLRCFEQKCSDDGKSITITVKDQDYVCTTSGEVLEGKAPQYGTITCPDIEEFCYISKICPNHCSANGVCVNGKCYCANGSTKDDCSMDCAANEYFDGGQNSCQTCESPCKRCMVHSQLCLTCIDGYILEQGTGKCIIDDNCFNEVISPDQASFCMKECKQRECQCEMGTCSLWCVRGKFNQFGQYCEWDGKLFNFKGQQIYYELDEMNPFFQNEVPIVEDISQSVLVAQVIVIILGVVLL